MCANCPPPGCARLPAPKRQIGYFPAFGISLNGLVLSSGRGLECRCYSRRLVDMRLHVLQLTFTACVLFFATGASAARAVAPPKTLAEALTTKFRCPTGAHDSGRGPSPGVIVRWCAVQRDGRLLYHGPVWR